MMKSEDFMVSHPPAALTPLGSAPQLHGAFAHRGPHQVAIHQHPWCELILVRAGRLQTACDGVEHRGVRGSLHVVPAGTRHDQRSIGDWQTSCILCSGVEDLLPHTTVTVSVAEDPLLARWSDDLIAMHHDGATAACKDALLLTLVLRVRSHLHEPTQDLPVAVSRACAWMMERLAEPLTDEAVATEVRLSVSHLGALFRQHLGSGPLRWLQDRRLDLAARLLTDPYATVSDISQRCGYLDTTHFIRHFRRRFGTTPGKIRRRPSLIRAV
jgi:AraC-like DNA-binding protein/mannose-6-phosphate isomerase-like protein (cupin superfamily)